MKNKGFTLIEVIVAMAVFAVIITVVLSLFSMALRGHRKVIALQNVQENARFLMDFMVKEIRMSTINNSTPASLSITRSDGNAVTYMFVGGKIERTSPSTSGPINSDEIFVTGSFYAEGGFMTPGNQQAKVTIVFKAESTGTKVEEKTSIRIQATLSQRNLGL